MSAATEDTKRRDYYRSRSKAVHAASQLLRERHRAEYAQLLNIALREEGLA